MVFDRIKESVRTGEAAGVIERHGGFDPFHGVRAADPVSIEIDQSIDSEKV
jgi:hypothetical protein